MIISVFGKSGSGKTTLTLNLSHLLASQGYLVGIVSLEFRYDSIAKTIGVDVPETKSILRAIIDSDNVLNYFVNITENLHLLSVSSETNIEDYEAIIYSVGTTKSADEYQKESFSSFLRNMNKVFDYIVIDCTDRITDLPTFLSLKQSDRVLNIIESNLNGVSFENAHATLNDTELWYGKKINLLNKHQEKEINVSTLQEIIKQPIQLVIEYNHDVLRSNILGKNSDFLRKKMKTLEYILRGTTAEKKGFFIKRFFQKTKG